VKKTLELQEMLNLAELEKLNRGEQQKAQINRHRQASAGSQ
jgi:hypothetical protein